jgi:predicted ATPase
MLALMTALFGETESNLIGIEEPENHVHPTALKAFAEYLLKAMDRVQILVTTHSPLLLDFLNEPGAVCVVRHSDQDGTRVSRENNSDAIVQALEASGFGLGEFYETKGFGG